MKVSLTAVFKNGKLTVLETTDISPKDIASRVLEVLDYEQNEKRAIKKESVLPTQTQDT